MGMLYKPTVGARYWVSVTKTMGMLSRPLHLQHATTHTMVQGRLHEKNKWETQMGKTRLGPTDVDGKGSMTIVDGKNRWGQSMGQWVVVTKTMGMFYTPIGGGQIMGHCHQNHGHALVPSNL